MFKQTDRLRKTIDDIEGIVLIDEIDKHLHIKIQREVLPKLIGLFPKIQFVLSTHSPFVNIGISDTFYDNVMIINMDHEGIECEADTNNVFREAYDVMINENNRYADECRMLKAKLENTKKPVVYLEGRTDEKYFNKALEIFGYSDKNVEFRWIGHLDAKGNEEFTGSGSLDKAIQFVKGQRPLTLQIFLFDSDTKKQEYFGNNIVVMVMPYFNEHILMNKGIENALELDGIELENFYSIYTHVGDYGQETSVKEFDKMKLCDYVCGLDDKIQY
ncbi:AAA family ATPase [Butyrivibrio sp. INlla16]|uniref:AAA family ATPase n=1 Tax=Butyrivibrio sp. INlla16 TaxID=1520807 RepID=UPI0008864051|nr:AAA family ATPase [Butyrivibrio sp. INlla16]SDB36520.1 AAA ATPase domain-containing protein [Butyrivibrio sp. INlla16]